MNTQLQTDDPDPNEPSGSRIQALEAENKLLRKEKATVKSWRILASINQHTTHSPAASVTLEKEIIAILSPSEPHTQDEFDARMMADILMIRKKFLAAMEDLKDKLVSDYKTGPTLDFLACYCICGDLR